MEVEETIPFVPVIAMAVVLTGRFRRQPRAAAGAPDRLAVVLTCPAAAHLKAGLPGMKALAGMKAMAVRTPWCAAPGTGTRSWRWGTS